MPLLHFALLNIASAVEECDASKVSLFILSSASKKLLKKQITNYCLIVLVGKKQKSFE